MAANPRFHALLERMAALHNRKNNDYASETNPYSNFEDAAATAGCAVDTVFLVLIGIKLARIRNLQTTHKTPNNESVADSKMDLAMYTALWTSYDQS